MEIRKAYQFRLEPNQAFRQQFQQFSGSCRFVWNKSLALQKERLEQQEKIYSYTDLASQLKEWKQEAPTYFLKSIHSQILQQSLKDLDRALWDGLNKKKGMPRFKQKGVHDSFRYPQGFKIEANKIYLPKIGWVRFRQSRELEGIPKNVTVSRKGKHWFVAIQVELEIEEPRHPSLSPVGIDMGVTHFATLSNGEVLEPLNSFKKLENQLAKEQRNLARKVKFSNNWKKQKLKIQQIHMRIGNARKDYLHKASTQISKNHAMIVMEDLRIANMSKSAKGTIEEPGRSVKAKSGLNRSILDQGWYSFRQMLDYKQLWRGGELRLVPPQYTSQKCSVCGHTEKENRKIQAGFVCLKCGHSENADLNASKNILAVGTTVTACGDIRRIAA